MEHVRGAASAKGVRVSERWVWDRYWQCDRIASCFDGAGASNYADAIAEGWRGFFADLPEQSRILDLCTGNGAIALIAAEVSRTRDKGFSITAVDQADIDPPAYVTRHSEDIAAICFVGRTEVEALPFPDASFDAVISQYGLEYADMDRAVPEAVRVLAPGGRARFVVHAAEGIVADNARTVIAEADLLLKDIDLIGNARRCFEAVARVDRGDSSDAAREQAKSAVAAFRSALQRTGRQISAAADPMMFHNSGGVLLDAFQARGRVGYDAVFEKVDRVESEILAHRGRLQALVDAALDQEGADALAATLRGAGATQASSSELRSDKGLIGYVIEARFG